MPKRHDTAPRQSIATELERDACLAVARKLHNPDWDARRIQKTFGLVRARLHTLTIHQRVAFEAPVVQSLLEKMRTTNNYATDVTFTAAEARCVCDLKPWLQQQVACPELTRAANLELYLRVTNAGRRCYTRAGYDPQNFASIHDVTLARLLRLALLYAGVELRTRA